MPVDLSNARPVAVRAAVIRRPLIVLAPVLVALAGALFLGLKRVPEYRAVAEINVSQGSTGASSGEAQETVGVYLRAFDLATVQREIVRRSTEASIDARYDVGGLPGGSVGILGRGATPEQASGIANLAASAVIDTLERARVTQRDVDRTLRDYRLAVADGVVADRVARRAERRLATGATTSAEQGSADSAREDLLQTQLREVHTREAVERAQEAATGVPRVRVRDAGDVDSDRASVLREYVILALLAGFVVGVAAALAVASHAQMRRPLSTYRPRWIVTGAVAGLALAAVAAVAVRAGYGLTGFKLGSLALFGLAAAYILWRLPPWISLSAGLVLTPFSGHWDSLGLPGGYVAPDRFLLLAGVATVLLRGPWQRDRGRLQVSALHGVLLVATLYAAASAAWSGTLLDQGSAFRLLEDFGVIPFLVFLVAPYAFPTARERRVLLGFMCSMGAYLGFTAAAETLHLDPLVWPRYILDPNVGIHFGRARGPFAEAVSNGTGLFVGAIAGGISAVTWQRFWTRLAGVALMLACLLALLLTLQRSVWLAGTVATLVTMIAVRPLRPLAVPAVMVAVVGVLAAFAVVPQLRENVTSRSGEQRTIWDRDNLNRASVNMIAAKPLIGFGWDTFRENSTPYFRQGDYPLTANGYEVHNLYLGYASTIGLIGTSLWIAGLLGAMFGGLRGRASPDLRPWRVGFGAFAVFYLIASAFVPAQVFPNLAFWLLAGVAWRAHVRDEQPLPLESLRFEDGRRSRVQSHRPHELVPASA